MLSNFKLAALVAAAVAVIGAGCWFADVNYDRGYAEAEADSAARIATQEAAIREAARLANEQQDADAERLTQKEHELNEILREITEASASDPHGAACGLPLSGVLRLRNLR